MRCGFAPFLSPFNGGEVSSQSGDGEGVDPRAGNSW